MRLRHEVNLEHHTQYANNKQTILSIDIFSHTGEIEIDMTPSYMNAHHEPGMISIGRYCSLAENVRFTIYGPDDYKNITTSPFARALSPKGKDDSTPPKKTIRIGHDVWIGCGAHIFNHVTIGDGAVVEAMTVVTEDVPPYAIVAGNPARITGYRFTEEQIEALTRIAWWYWPKERLAKYTHALGSPRIDALIAACRMDDIAKKLAVTLNQAQIDDLKKDYGMPLENLTTLQVEVSSACNLKCPQCYNQVEDHVSKLLTPKVWDTRIKPHLDHVKLVHLVGIGEPLLNKHFFTFVDDVRHGGAEVTTTSNLHLVTPAIADQLLNLSQLSFSCDGASREVYDAIRGPGGFERLETALADIVAAKTRAGSSTPALGLNFGASRHNIANLPEVVTLAARYGVEWILAFHNIVYSASKKEESLFHDQALSDDCFAEAGALCKRYGIRFSSPSLFRSPRHHPTGMVYCGFPFGYLYICSDGRVTPCCMDWPDRIFLGNVLESDLPEVWNSQATRNLRRELCTIPSDTCRYCADWFSGKETFTDPRHLFRFPGAEAYIASLPRTR